MSMPGEAPASGRAAVPGLVSPAPFIDRLPALYADSDFTGRFVAAFDDVLAPVFAVLDCLEAYLDPSLAPADFLAMLGRWTAADTDASQPALPNSPDSPDSSDSSDSSDARRLVAEATACHAARGTIRGLAQRLTRVFGIDADISDNGGVSWSATPSGPLPGRDDLFLRVRLRAPSGDALPMQRIKTLIEDDRPAHVPVWIDVVDTSEVVDQDRQEPSP
jgi:phage tail-like protein